MKNKQGSHHFFSILAGGAFGLHLRIWYAIVKEQDYNIVVSMCIRWKG